MADLTPLRRAAPALTVVTGAAGWFGRAFVQRLLDDPDRRVVRVLVRDDVERAGLPGHDRLEVVLGDVTERTAVRRLLRDTGSDTDVVHAAGVIHPARGTREFGHVNVGGTRTVVEAALSAGVRRVVHISSNSPFGTNPHPDDRFREDEPYRPYYGYGRSKMQAELVVRSAVDAGLDAVIVRPPWFYGPFQPARQTTFFKLVRTGKFPVIGSGLQRRSMVYIDNLVDGVVAAELTEVARGRGYWIADARPYTVAEIVGTVAAALADAGYPVSDRTMHLPAVVGRIAEAADAVVQGLGRYHQQIHVLGEMDKTIACDISAARRDLGYEPAVELAEGMRRSIAWCHERGIDL